MPQEPSTDDKPAAEATQRHKIIIVTLQCASAIGVAYLLYDFSQSDFSYMGAAGFDILGGYAFLFTAVCLLSLFRRKTKHRLITLFVSLVLYVGSYSALSAFGEYHWSWSGRLRYSAGLSVTDTLHWYPKGVYWERYTRIDGTNSSRGTCLGYYYSPLVIFDRMWFHPSNSPFSDKP